MVWFTCNDNKKNFFDMTLNKFAILVSLDNKLTRKKIPKQC